MQQDDPTGVGADAGLQPLGQHIGVLVSQSAIVTAQPGGCMPRSAATCGDWPQAP